MTLNKNFDNYLVIESKNINIKYDISLTIQIQALIVSVKIKDMDQIVFQSTHFRVL